MQNHLKIDEYGQIINCAESALAVLSELESKGYCAIPLALGNGTLFHMSFLTLWRAIPDGIVYEDGSARGIQINIDRHSSYSLPRATEINESGYLAEKWGLGRLDADALLPFFNTVLNGENHYE